MYIHIYIVCQGHVAQLRALQAQELCDGSSHGKVLIHKLLQDRLACREDEGRLAVANTFLVSPEDMVTT